ncbi:MAG: pyruvate formate lyase family protein, partial [Armatimonadetes bacterium]|nr:pyruvate formate lyase family protein [Armatimonadota bacterium]
MCTDVWAQELAARDAPTQRIARLREEALAEGPPVPWQVEMLRGEAFRDSQDELWWVIRRARQTAHVLRNIDVVIGPEDVIVGRPPKRPPTDEEQERLAKAREYLAAQPRAGGQSGHMAPDFDSLLRLGCRGLRQKIASLSARLDPADPASPPKLAFYRAADEALRGLVAFAERYADHAERLAETEADVRRRDELRHIANLCRWVPNNPARTFHEALQAAHFLLFALNYAEGCNLSSPGSIDRWLWPYLKADLEAGRIDLARAQELLDEFFITFNFYIGRGLAIGALVGGRDAEAKDVCNPVTWMALRSVDHVRLAYPSLGLRVHSATAPELVDYALEILADGTSNPALFNDEVITDGLLAAGLPRADACDYMNSTCVEITPCGKSNVWVASPYINLPGV